MVTDARTNVQTNHLPPELLSLPAGNWRWEWRGDKRTKPVYSPTTGAHAEVNDPSTWGTFPQALERYHRDSTYDGIGVLLPDDCSLTAVDLDNAIAADGTPMLWAQRIIDQLQSYTEVTPSRCGLRVWVRATKPVANCTKAMPDGGKIEIYDHLRYMTVTGKHLPGTPTTIAAHQDELNQLCHSLWPPKRQRKTTTTGGGGRSDDGVIDAILAHPKLARLWHGDDGDYNGDASRGDLAMCNVLRDLTGGDVVQMDRLFRSSGRMRDKWDTRHAADGRSYGQLTVAKSLEGWTNSSSPNGTHEPTEASTPDDTATRGTDAGNASLFVQQYGDQVRYVSVERMFYVFDGVRWIPDRTEQVRHLISEMVRTMYREAADIADSTDRKLAIDRALKLERAKPVKDLLYMLQADRRVAATPEQFDTGQYLLNVLNGTIDLRTGQLLAHNPDDMITKLAPVTYDPNARLDLWEHVITTATGNDPALLTYIQRFFGSAITGDPREEIIGLAHGPTGTAKSTVTKAITSCLGDYAKVADFATFLHRRDVGGARPDLVRLRGARLVVSLEVDEGRKLAEGLLKTMTGGDTVTARDLYKGEVEIEPTWTLLLVANDRPKARAEDDAIWRRMREIPFDRQIPEADRDPAVKSTLTDPAIAGPAILAWLVRGCLDWQAHGLTTPQRVREATADYRSSMDTFSGWLADCCVRDTSAKATSAELLDSYRVWCKVMDTEPVSPNAFALRLTGIGCESKRSKSARYWAGIGLLGSHHQGRLLDHR